MTRFILRLLIVPIGIGFAAIAALVCALAGMLTWGYDTGLALIAAATGVSIVKAMMAGIDPSQVIAFMALLCLLMLGLLVLPVTLVALVGELFRIGTWMPYAFGTGGAFVLIPVIFRGDPATHDWPANATLGFLATGIVAGTVYWLIAGRGAALRKSPSAPVVHEPRRLERPAQSRESEPNARLHGSEG